MAASDPMEILLAHDAWATGQILHACERLSPEQFARKFEMGPGSLQWTLTHIMGAMRVWTDTLAERPSQPLMDHTTTAFSVGQLREMLAATAAELAGQARRLPLDATVKRVRQGKEYTFTRGTVLTHVTTHAMHHRAQCLNMLRQLGVSPLPPSSVVEWSRQVDQP